MVGSASAAGVAGAAVDRDFLAVELGAPGHAHSLPVFPAVARLHPGGGCPCIYAHLNFIVDALQMGICHAVCGLFTGMVVV